MRDFRIEQRRTARHKREVVVHGELGLATVGELRRELERAAQDGDDVAVDLSPTTLVDAAGVGALVRAAGSAARHGRRVRLVAASFAVRRMLRLAGADGLLLPHRSRAAGGLDARTSAP